MKVRLCEAVERDLGRSHFFTELSEINNCIHSVQLTIEEFPNWARAYSVDTPLIAKPGNSYIVPEPLGVVAIMGAWNYPITTLLTPLIDCIAAGNCVLIKPSEIAPNTAIMLGNLCIKYLDGECYRVYQGKSRVSKAISEMRWDMIAFTGSPEKGRLIAEVAGRNLVPCLLELGGKCPTIVDDTCDIDFAAQKILLAKMPNMGQLCITPDYILCHHTKQD
jgi:aldehyde dehydrogenase (NAD+)